MGRALYSNYASGTLNAGINSVATSLVLSSGQGSLFPSPTNGDYFYATLSDAATGNNQEIVKCTGVAVDTFTIVRGQQGTSGLSFLAGDYVQIRVTSGGMNELSLGSQHGKAFFHTAGTTSWTCPSGVTSVSITVVPGGGGGESGSTTRAGSGGGAAGIGKAFSVAVTPFSVYSLTVGAGGTGGSGSLTAGTNPGTNGSSSSFTGDSVTVSASGAIGGNAGVPGRGTYTFQNIDIAQKGHDGYSNAGYSGGDGGNGDWSTVGQDGNGPTPGEGYSGGGGGGKSATGGNGSTGYVLIEW